MDFKIPDTPEELFNQGRQKIGKFGKWTPYIVTLVVVLGFFASSFYSISPDEVGIIRRFGKYVCTTSPGLHWKLPFNIEKLSKVKVKRIFKEEFGFRTLKSGITSRYSSKSYLDESLMLTGDLNVLEVTWIVQFKDPFKVLFNIRNPKETVRDISESVMREIVGDSSVNETLTSFRIEINQKAQGKLQDILDHYESGIQIVTVKLQDVNPPDEVKPSFNDVNEAKQEKEKVINQSWEAYNKVIPRALGEAGKTIKEAEGYALKRVNRAQGDAAKFLATWTAYKEAKDVTRKRLYLETLSESLPRAKHIYVTGTEYNSMLPILDLKKE